MSGAEVIGLISGITSIIDAAIKISAAASSAIGLPPSFRDVAARLPLTRDTLQKAQVAMQEDSSISSYKLLPTPASTAHDAAVTKLLEACKEKASALESIFLAVIPPSTASRTERYLRALKTIPKADKVETLMAGILADMQVLTGNLAVGAATRGQMKELLERIENMGRVSGAVGGGDSSGEGDYVVTMQNTGEGEQIVYMGRDGNQVVNLGSGGQFNGPMSGTFNFG